MSSCGYLVCALLWVTVGFAMKYLVITGAVEPLPAGSEDNAAPMFLSNHTPPWLAGIAFAGLFAAIMSTADSFLNIGAGVCVRDFPRAFLKRPVKNELFWARVATLGLAVVATLFALWARQRGDPSKVAVRHRLVELSSEKGEASTATSPTAPSAGHHQNGPTRALRRLRHPRPCQVIESQSANWVSSAARSPR